MKKLLSFIFVLITLSSSAYAGKNDIHGAKITEVYINSEGVMLMRVDSLPTYLSIGKVGNKSSELMYSTALAAKLSGQSNLWVRYWDAAQGFPTVGIISVK